MPDCIYQSLTNEKGKHHFISCKPNSPKNTFETMDKATQVLALDYINYKNIQDSQPLLSYESKAPSSVAIETVEYRQGSIATEPKNYEVITTSSVITAYTLVSSKTGVTFVPLSIPNQPVESRQESIATESENYKVTTTSSVINTYSLVSSDAGTKQEVHVVNSANPNTNLKEHLHKNIADSAFAMGLTSEDVEMLAKQEPIDLDDEVFNIYLESRTTAPTISGNNQEVLDPKESL